jgi:preprotein translocase subunit SecF
MEFFKPDISIDFMKASKWAAILSVSIFIFSLASLFIKGIHKGLDFTGGTQIELSFQDSPNLEEMRNNLIKAGFDQIVVQNYGSSKGVLINIAPKEGVSATQLLDKVLTIFPDATKKRNEYIGPQVGKELATKGFLAIVISLLGTLVYIAIRFEFKFAVCSVLALIHDPILILGMFSFLQLEFDLKVLGALLAILGYSINDTIVVFDRVRENFRKHRKKTVIEIMNLSINQTLSRTIMTSMLTLIVVLALYVFGGEALKNFSLTLIIGIIIGTYSSIYVAGACAVAMGLKRTDLIPQSKETVDNRP